MSSPKQRRKARRRAERWMDEAWEAVLRGDLAAAEKQSRRAVEAGPVNPRLWLDHGRILRRCGEDTAAGEAFRQAIALAPTFAEAFAELASLQASRGKVVPAERLQARAVELDPGDAAARRQLESYRAALPPGPLPGGDAAREPPAVAARPGRFGTERYDWHDLARELRARGMARLPGLLSGPECAALIALWQAPDCFDDDVVRGGDLEAPAERRYFAPPLPEPVVALRAEVWARAAPIGNDFSERLGRRERFPAALEEFLARCRDVGQRRSSAAMLRLGAGGSEAPQRETASRVAFPFELAVALGPGGRELVLVDQRPGRRVHQRRLALAAGDGALHAARERLVDVAGAVGAQAVKHGIAPAGGTCHWLRLPFHDHG